MSKQELTEAQVAKLKAHSQAIQNLQQKFHNVQSKLQEEQMGLEALKNEIAEQAGIENPPPISEWRLDQVDWQNFAGSVVIPEPQPEEEVSDDG